MTSNPKARFAAIADRIRLHAGADGVGRPASEELIQSIERELGTQLPESYRQCLAEFGWLEWPDCIWGAIPDHSRVPSVVRNWRDERFEVYPPMPKYLIPFGPDGWGNHYCLDTRRFEGDECPVVFWNHEKGPRQRPKVTHASFLDWLEYMVERELQWEREEAEEQARAQGETPPADPDSPANP